MQAKRSSESGNDKIINFEKSPTGNDMMKPTITYDKNYLNKFGGSTTQESMPGNGWRDSLSNLKGATSPASSPTLQMKANTVSQYSIEDVLQNEEEKLPGPLMNEDGLTLNKIENGDRS